MSHVSARIHLKVYTGAHVPLPRVNLSLYKSEPLLPNTQKKNNHNTSLAPLQHCLGCSKHIVDPLSLSFSPVEQRGQKDSRETELGAWNPPQPHRWQRVEISDWPPAVPSLRPLSCRHQDFWLSLPSPLASILQTRVGGAEPFA